MSLVELHAHSYFSFLDALASPEDLAVRAKELGYTALALTDHGGLFGVPRFMRAATAAGVKPIVGCELYVSPTTRADRSPDLRPVGHHLTILAETVEGYKNLAKLSSAGYVEGFFHRPRVDLELLAGHSKGLILLTGCIHSALAECVLKEDEKGVSRLLGFYVESFGRDRVFIELQRHGLEKEETLLGKLSGLSRSHHLARVATNDVHYLDALHADTHQIAMDLRSRKMPTDPRRERFLKPAYGMLTEEEWKTAFQDGYSDVFETAASIAARCSLTPEDVRHLAPAETAEPASRLKVLVEKEAARRWKHIPNGYPERISEELAGLRATGLSAYLLMIHEMVAESKRQGIAVGPGRGSSAGSLVAYLLDITEIDPMEHRLSFDRFLSPSRKTLPDVDVDVDFRARDRVIEILQTLVPSARIFRAGTISSIGLKSSIREIARNRGLPYRDVDEKIRSLPAGTSRLEQEDRQPWKDLAPMVNLLAPVPRMTMGHPTAVMAVPQSLEAFLPVYASPEGQRWLQYDSEDLDWMGIPKLDVLPLRILSVISETIRWLKLSGVADLDIRSIPPDDAETFALVSRGETAGIFQLESPGMRQLLRDIAPASIETLAVALALYRPGPLETDLPRAYIERKNGRVESLPPHALFEPVLKETFGLVIYQEQVIACARRAGLTADEADEFRVAVSKKNVDSMKHVCARFEKALRAKGLSEKESAHLVSRFTPHAAFSFNKAHAISYSLLSYRAAYLKSHFPAAFLASTVNAAQEDRKQMGEIFSEARRLGIQVLPPDVQAGSAECVPDPGGRRLRLGLDLIRHVSASAVSEISRSRPFSDIPDLLMKVPSLWMPREALEMLCKAGALDAFGIPRKDMLPHLPEWIERAKKSSKQGGFQTELFSESTHSGAPGEPSGVRAGPENPNPGDRGHLFLEYEALGFFATGSPLDDMGDIRAEFCNGTLAEVVSRASSGAADPPGRSGSAVTVVGLLMALRPHVDRSGREMAFATIEDGMDSLDVVFFHDVFQRTKSMLVPGTPMLLRGRLEKRGASATLLADQVVETDKPERLYESILLKLEEGIGMDVLRKVKEILKDHLGDRPVYVEMTDGGGTFEFRVGWSCRPSAALRRTLETLLGPYSVFFLKTADAAEPARL